jgi:hypothetical protein
MDHVRNLKRSLARPLTSPADESVRTLPSHRHNDISDLKISNLVRPTSVRPVTVSAISLNFRKLVVRFLEVPDIFRLL